MIGMRLRVAYEDGRTEVLTIRAPAVIAWEDYARRHGIPAAATDPANMPAGFSPFTMFSVLAWAQTGVAEGFNVWAQTVDGVEPLDEELELPDPFPVERSQE